MKATIRVVTLAALLCWTACSQRGAFAGYEEEVLADTPWVYYQFNETSGDIAADSSGNGRDGEYVDVELGEPSAGAGLGTAIRLDGVSGLVNVPPLDFESDQLTIETWLNMDFITGNCCTSVFSPAGWEQGWLHYNLGDSGGGRVEFALNNGGPNDRWTEGGTLELEEWAHIASTYDKDEALARMFINGEEVDFDIPGFDTPQTVTLIVEAQIGAWEDSRYVSGAIDEFAIYDSVLSPERIKSHFDNRDVLGGETALRPGDADQDLDFDQLDLVQVQIAAKYLTGAAATWGEGDWDGAPGGMVGDPPAGNGLFDQLDIIAALNASIYLTGPYAAIAPGGNTGDGQTSIIYSPSTGEVGVDAPVGKELTSINIDSAASIFTGDAAQNLGGSFDNDADNNVFKATFGSSFGSLSFGSIAQAGLSKDFVLNDLTAVGSLSGGGDLGTVDLIYVPEPAAALLLAIGGVAGLLNVRRKR
jgi:hypothetical protein